MVFELADSSCLMVDRGHIGLEYVYVCEDKPENFTLLPLGLYYLVEFFRKSGLNNFSPEV